MSNIKTCFYKIIYIYNFYNFKMALYGNTQVLEMNVIKRLKTFWQGEVQPKPPASEYSHDSSSSLD